MLQVAFRLCLTAGDELKVWYDACTGKHVRYAVAVSHRLKGLGHEVILTTRRHPDTIDVAKQLNEDFKVVGSYAPASASSRLKASLNRQLAFSAMFADEPPDCGVSHGSVDLCRVAFGLGTFVVSTADAPHAIAANKLGLPLVNILIASRAIPKKDFEVFGVRKISQFDGVDEVAWVRNHQPRVYEYDKPLIVVRQMETLASYAQGKQDLTETIAHKLSRLGKVLFIPRYDRRPRPGLIVPTKSVDSVSLSLNADLVVSVGGTISREAALQGTPSIVIRTFGKSYVNDFLSERGFPLFTTESSKVLKLAEKYISQRWDVKRKLEQLENPVDYVQKAVQKKI